MRLLAIIKLIKSLYPEATESMKYKMPTYEYKDGWVSVANQKHYISLYTCSVQHLKTFKQKHPTIKTGKGCINFKDNDDIVLEDIRPVIISAMDYMHG